MTGMGEGECKVRAALAEALRACRRARQLASRSFRVSSVAHVGHVFFSFPASNLVWLDRRSGEEVEWEEGEGRGRGGGKAHGRCAS